MYLFVKKPFQFRLKEISILGLGVKTLNSGQFWGLSRSVSQDLIECVHWSVNMEEL